MSNKATLATVQGIKESLSKEVEKGEDMSAEAAKDMLDQLDKCKMTMGILTKSLIGTVVSKLKKHDELGPTAKSLIKKWKQVAKDAEAAKTQTRRGSNSSTGSAAAAAAAAAADVPLANAEEWDDLAPQRRGMCQKLHKFLGVHKTSLVKSGINEEALDHLMVARATEIEFNIHNKYSGKDDYAAKSRSLCFNLKKNGDLAESVILGQTSPENLVDMSSEELASSEARKAREEGAKKLIDSKRLDWDQANEDKINEM